METIIYSQEGKEAGKLALPQDVFGLPWNADLVHQVVHAMLSNKRANTADATNRGEVEGSRAKPWAQKGTGRARHGDKRSPIWRGGGVTHGPTTDKNYKKKINKKMKQKALYTILSAKLRDGKVLFVDGIDLKEAKTKEAAQTLGALATIKNFAHLSRKDANIQMAFVKRTPTITRAFKNLPQVNLTSLAQLNPVDVSNARYVIIAPAKEAVAAFGTKA